MRALVAACCLAGLTTGCSVTASASPAAPATISAEDVRALTGIDSFGLRPDAESSTPQALSNVPEPCRALYDPVGIFGGNPTVYRAVVQDAWIEQPVLPELAKVVQEVAVYTDPAAAQSQLDRARDAVTPCVAARDAAYDKQMSTPDPSTILLDGAGADYVLRAAGATLIRVSVVLPDDGERTALQIADRLGNA